MKKIIVLLLALTTNCFAKSTAAPYQVDLIIFAHQNNPENVSRSDLILNTKNTLTLQDYVAKSNAFYQRLSSQSSHLQREYYALNHNAEYKMLAHYSWLQPANNQQCILLPLTNRDGLQMQGTIRIRQSQYYLLDSQFVFSSLDKNEVQFALSKTARLKDNTMYYFDHPGAGILIKIHKIS